MSPTTRTTRAISSASIPAAAPTPERTLTPHDGCRMGEVLSSLAAVDARLRELERTSDAHAQSLAYAYSIDFGGACL